MLALTPGAPHPTPQTFFFVTLAAFVLPGSKTTIWLAFFSVIVLNLFFYLLFIYIYIIGIDGVWREFVKSKLFLKGKKCFCGVCQTVGLWFVMWAKGKFGGWSASVPLRIQ